MAELPADEGDRVEAAPSRVGSCHKAATPFAFPNEVENMEKFEIQPILSSAIPDVANFLHRWHAARGQHPVNQRPIHEELVSAGRRLQWLLVQNPVGTTTSGHGFCVRNTSGAIMGLILTFPGMFLAADERITGLCSGSFFVDPQARIQGFYLFKRYLNSPNYRFFYGTTCNANSGVLWAKMGGCAVPKSETEYILPINLEVMLPTFLAKSNSGEFKARIARAFGRCANPVFEPLLRKPAKLCIEPCRDWEKLSALFRLHRSANLITSDRSPAFLQWRYGQGSPNHSSDIHLFRDKRGNEGWFSLANITRGRRAQIRGCLVLDAIWPRERMTFGDIFPTILRLVASKVDAIFFQSRPDVDYSKCSRWIVPRRLDGPQAFAMARKGSGPLTISSLDLVPADGDSAF
jgi:hypothetical protein